MGYRYNPPCLQKGGPWFFQIITGKSQSCRVLGNYLNLYLITDSHLKTKCVMIMIPIKLVLKAIRDKQRCLSKPLYTCFVDFTKAFDYIDRTALYYKLLNRGIDGNLLNIIRSMFSKAECRVKWDSRISDILKANMGFYKAVCSVPNYSRNFYKTYQQHLTKIKVSLWTPY